MTLLSRKEWSCVLQLMGQSSQKIYPTWHLSPKQLRSSCNWSKGWLTIGLPRRWTFGNLFHVQSRNYCFVMETLLGKNLTAAFQEFSDVFVFFLNLFKEGLPLDEQGPKFMPLLIWSPQDLSSLWKSLNMGSAARKSGDKHFCHLHPCAGGQISSYVVGENR